MTEDQESEQNTTPSILLPFIYASASVSRLGTIRMCVLASGDHPSSYSSVDGVGIGSSADHTVEYTSIVRARALQ